MIAAPYYLLAAGILLIVLGVIFAAVMRPTIDKTYIDPRMSDKQIKKQLENADGNPAAAIVILLGFVLCGVSVIWRVVRIFV
ncbi:MAG: hypothetical protein WEB58_15035 [Planctomycetaceae bacterium]